MFLPPLALTIMQCSSELGDCVFVSTQDGWTSLHLAAQEGKVDVVRLLLTEAQALVNIQMEVHSYHIMTLSTVLLSVPLMLATRAENVNSMYVLLVFQ